MRLPRTDSVAILAGHRLGDLGDVVQVVGHPRGPMIPQRHPAPLRALGINVFRAFHLRNLKPQRRQHSSMLHIARCLAAERYQGRCEYAVPIPT